MATTIVKDTAGLVSALKAAKAGDVIQLQAGTYAPATITGVKIDGQVTITSQDPTAMAKLTGLNVRDSEGLTFRGLEFVVDGARIDHSFQFSGTKNINLDGLNVHGSLDGNPLNDGSAILIRNSTDVSVTNSEFHELKHGVAHIDSNGLRIADNEFHDIRTDGIRGGGSSNVTISGNYFTDFHMAEGDHADAIQFWTTNTTKSVSNITVENNVVLRGSGDPIQGVYFHDLSGVLPYTDVKIIGNLVIGGTFHGITLLSGKNVEISDNVVAGLPDQKSWISVAKIDGLTLSGNTSTDYLFNAVTNLVRSGDVTVAVPTDGGKELQAAWLRANGTPAMTLLQTDALRVVEKVTSVSDLTRSAMDAQADTALVTMAAARLNAVKVTGTSEADSLKTHTARDTLVEGGAGNDVIHGGGIGHNTLSGGAGDDTYYVRGAFESVVESEGQGTDTVVSSFDFALGAHIERLRLTDEAYFGAGNDLSNRITGSDLANELLGLGGDDLIQAVGGDDLVSGGDGADTLRGGEGNDTLGGDAGGDLIVGDEGSDSLSGGLGVDTLEGGAGADTLAGGAGADSFVFRQHDVGATDWILDFSRAEGDKINLVAVDANANLAGDQKFAFIGAGAFTKVAGQLRAVVSDGNTILSGDTNGDGVADFQVVVVGQGTLQAADFFL